MIVKVKNDVDSWSYFECEIIHSQYCSWNSVSVSKKKEAVILLEAEPVGQKGDKQVKALNLETLKSHFRTIITDRVCYIMNNEGKTIDKI